MHHYQNQYPITILCEIGMIMIEESMFRTNKEWSQSKQNLGWQNAGIVVQCNNTTEYLFSSIKSYYLVKRGKIAISNEMDRRKKKKLSHFHISLWSMITVSVYGHGWSTTINPMWPVNHYKQHEAWLSYNCQSQSTIQKQKLIHARHSVIWNKISIPYYKTIICWWLMV